MRAFEAQDLLWDSKAPVRLELECEEQITSFSCFPILIQDDFSDQIRG